MAATVAEVICVGSCNTDLISYVDRLPKLGETLAGIKFSVGFGGKGANQAVCCARLGAKVAMVGRVGDDLFGHDTIKNFKSNNVNVDHLYITKDMSTGVAPIAVDKDGNNAIIIVPGANHCITVEDLAKSEPLIQTAKVLLCQLEVEPHISLAAMKLARQHNVTTVFNPAPAVANLDPELFKYCDIFCPNETEAELFTGLRVTNVEEAKSAAVALLKKHCQSVIITLGEKGAVFVDQGDTEVKHVPCKYVEAVDTTGAGDAFVGSLAFYLARHRNLTHREMIQRACDIASISVLSPGTQKSYPLRNEIPSELFS